MNPNQGFHPSNQGTPSPQPYQPPHKRSLEDIVTQFVQTQQSTNTEFRTALNDVRSQITKLTSSIGNLQQEKGKVPSQPIQNPQGQIVWEVQVQVREPLNTVRPSLLSGVGRYLTKPFKLRN